MHHGPDVHHVGAVHVGRGQDELVVDADLAQRVQTFKHQAQFPGAQYFLVQEEGAAVEEVLADLLIGLLLIVPEEGIVQELRVHEVRVHGAGNSGGMPLHVAGGAHLPLAAKGNHIVHIRNLLDW